MNATLLAAIVAALAGLVAGAVASLVAPWANWGVDKRRATRKERRKLIDSWQRMVAKQLRSETRNLDEMIRSDEYLSLRKYLDLKLVGELEARPRKIYVVQGRDGLSGDPPLKSLAARVDELEREWALA